MTTRKASADHVISGGAMFNSAKATVSAETQNLLKLMMQESKLTNLQQRQLSQTIKNGKPLPVPERQTKSTRPLKPQTKVMSGRQLSLSGKRKKEAIDAINEKQQHDVYRPSPGRLITDKDKMMLQNKMAYGEHAPDLNRNLIKQTQRSEHIEVEQEIDEFDQVLQQIEERRAFLTEMERLGQGKKYQSLIQTEISQKIRDLEQIDKKRTLELEQQVTEEASSSGL